METYYWADVKCLKLFLIMNLNLDLAVKICFPVYLDQIGSQYYAHFLQNHMVWRLIDFEDLSIK